MYDIDLDPQARRLEQELDQLSLMDQPDCFEDFRPIGQCEFCDEPFERGYECHACHEHVCPACVCSDLRQPDGPLAASCPECEGAGFWL